MKFNNTYNRKAINSFDDIYPILYLQECIKKYKSDWIVYMNPMRLYLYYSINEVIYSFYDYYLYGNEFKGVSFGNRKVNIDCTKFELFKYRLKYIWWKLMGHSWATHSYNAIKYDDYTRSCIENEIK